MKINNIKTQNFYQKTANFIEKSPKTQKILKFADSSPSLFNSTIVFGLATILRPSTILLMSNDTDKDSRKDSLYSASKSIASGICDMGFSLAVFLPLNKLIDKSTRLLFDNKNNLTYYKNKEACSAWKSIVNRGAKISLLPIISYLNFKYIKDIATFINRAVLKINGGNKNNDSK